MAPKTNRLEAARAAHQRVKAPPLLDQRVLAALRSPPPRGTAHGRWYPALAGAVVVATVAGLLFLGVCLASLGSAPAPEEPTSTTPQLHGGVPVAVKAHSPQLEPALLVSTSRTTPAPSSLPSSTAPSSNTGRAPYPWAQKHNLLKVDRVGREVRLTPHVVAEIVSPNTLIKRMDDAHFLLMEGAARFRVAPLPPGERFVVEAAKSTIQVMGTRFLVSLDTTHLSVALEEGKILFTYPNGKTKLLAPGERLVVERHRPITRAFVRRKLQALRSRGQHRQAARFITRILPRVRSSALKQSLLFDLASIRGEHLHDFVGSCSILRSFRKRYPTSRFRQTVSLFMNKYRCN